MGGCDRGAPYSTAPPSSVLDSLPASPVTQRPPGPPPHLAQSQTLYVPAYSHIYVRDAERTVDLATTLSIRNASPDHALTLTAIEYYDSHGTLVRTYTDTARTLGPLASTYVVVEANEVPGGVGANFLVKWQADPPVQPPLVETIMITTESTLGISFRSTARVLREETAPQSESQPEPQSD